MNRKLVSGIVFWAAGVAQASMAPQFTLEEMIDRSERIVQGRVVRAWAAWDAEHRFIWTHNEIQVSDTVKGARTATVVVSEPGGVVDGLQMSIEGVTQYQPGEEVILFLYQTPIGFLRSRGAGQGKFIVLAEPSGPERRVRSHLNGVLLLEPAGATTRQGTDLRQLNGARVEDFLSRVRGLVARQARGAR